MIVVESNNTKVKEKFERVATNYKDRHRALMVGVKDEEQAISSGEYDNCYVIGPNSTFQRYFIPTNEAIMEEVTEDAIKNIFRVASLPRAIVLR